MQISKFFLQLPDNLQIVLNVEMGNLPMSSLRRQGSRQLSRTADAFYLQMIFDLDSCTCLRRGDVLINLHVVAPEPEGGGMTLRTPP